DPAHDAVYFGTDTTPAQVVRVNLGNDASHVPSVPDLATASDHGASSGDNITNDTMATFNGMAEPNSTVSVWDYTTFLGSSTVDAAGNWSFTPAAPLAEGMHAILGADADANSTSMASPSLIVK